VSLATVGLYGLLGFSVAKRSREIGIRVALGAQAHQVRRSVLGEGLALACGGAALGLGIGIFLSIALEPLLYGVEPRDPRLFAAAAALMIMVAAFASYFPARRATLVQPISTLRVD
jgi:ABC-type antimicrobial peptide transport system permease subunit